MTEQAPVHSIGTVQETSLHAALKEWYAQPGDLLEASVDGYRIDVLRGDLLIEIQTRNFRQLKPKLTDLIARYQVRLVYPIAQERWILRVQADGCTPISRRKSPKHGRLEQVFAELASLPHLLAHPNFSLEVLFIHDEEIRCHDGRGSWRHKEWTHYDRRLIKVVGRTVFTSPDDFRSTLSLPLPEPFSSQELALALSQPRRLAQSMIYCLREMNLLQQVGRRSRERLYAPAPAKP